MLRSQTEMTIYCMIPFIQNIQKRHIYRNRIIFARGYSEGTGLITNMYRGSFRDARNVLKLDFMIGAQLHKLLSYQIVHLKQVNFMVCKLYFNKPALKSLQEKYVDNMQNCVLEINFGRKCAALMGVGESRGCRDLNAYGRAPIIIEQRKYKNFVVSQASI